jgi:hypothetical protein
MLINHLKCRVRIVGATKGPAPALRSDAKPELKFVKATPIPADEPVRAEPRDEVEEVELEPTKVDPKLVADQVYEIMIREARQGRLRRGF